MAAIEALPLVQTPEVFGLHANADISYYTSATKALWRNLVGPLHQTMLHSPQGTVCLTCIVTMKLLILKPVQLSKVTTPQTMPYRMD